MELGLRSENARLAEGGEPHQVIEVDYIEPTGADLFVNGRAAGQDIVVRVERTARIAPGDRLPVRWQLDLALVFDAETGMRL